MTSTDPAESFAARRPTAPAFHLRDARLAALQHVALGLTSTLQLSEVLQRVAHMAQSLTDSAHAHIYLYDAASDEIHHGASHWAKDQPTILLKPRRTGITYAVIQSGAPQYIEDARTHAAYDGVPVEQRPGALASLPLTKAGRVLGTLNIGYWQTHPFDQDTRQFLDLMAQYAAIAIDNAQLYESATRAAGELRRLYDTSLDIARQLDAPNLLNLIIHRAAELLRGDSGNFYLYDSQTDELVPCAPFGQHELEPVQRLKPGEGATGRVFQSGEPLVIHDYDGWEGRVAQIPLGKYGRALHVPVKQGERIIGVMSVNRPQSAPAFTEDETRLLMLFANQAAVALENARLYQVAGEKARMEHELEMARQLQASLIPQAAPQIAGWEFQARWYPARQVSGDYFDFVNTSLLQRFLIADVSDKGMSAALFMALTRSTLRASIADERSPATMLTHANRLLCVDTANGMFVTLCYAQLDPATGDLVYVNAGHNLPLWYRRQPDQLIEFERTGPALGILNEYAYTQQSVRLEPGDFVLFYTDGVTDALNPAGEDFGEERLRRALFEHRHRSAGEIVAAIEQSLWSFTDHQTPADDVTIVLVKRL